MEAKESVTRRHTTGNCVEHFSEMVEVLCASLSKYQHGAKLFLLTAAHLANVFFTILTPTTLATSFILYIRPFLYFA